MATEPDEGQPAAASDVPGGVAGPPNADPTGQRADASWPPPSAPQAPHAQATAPRPTESQAPERRPSDPRRRVLILTPVVAVIVGVAVALANLPSERPVAGGEVSASPSASAMAIVPGYLVSADELRQRGEMAARGEEPYASAVVNLMEWANDAVNDDAKPTQPLLIVGTDNEFVDDARRAYGLGLAYVLTGDERYAQAARRTLRSWMDLTTTTTDTCPDSGGCHTSLIIGRAGAGFAFGADLIAGSEFWTSEDRGDLQAWLKGVLLPAVSHRPNNWGDAGTFLRVVAADYAGDQREFDLAIDKWRSLIDLIEPDGRIPEEVRRGAAGISYTQEALQYKVAVARIAERRGIDLWDYVGKQGGSLRKAIDRLAYYWHRPDEWPDYAQPTVPSTGPLWEIAYAHWPEPGWVDILLDGRPYGDRGHSAIRWTTLTNGIPVDTLVAGGPSGSPSTAPSPTATVTPSATQVPVPSVGGLAVSLGSPLGNPLPIAIQWDAPDATGVELERSIAGGDWSAMKVAPNGRSASDSLRLGQVTAYRVRAVIAGTAGPWTTLDDVSAERIEATSRTVDLSGSWARIGYGSYSGGSALSTDQRGARLVWRGTTQSIAIIGPTGPTRGRMVVTVDGARADDIDLRSTHFRPRNLLFTMSWDVAGVHELEIEARPSSGRRTVAVDDIVTLRSTLIAPPGS
jgi:Alginate lyase